MNSWLRTGSKRPLQFSLALILFLAMAAPVRFYSAVSIPLFASFSVVELALAVAIMFVLARVFQRFSLYLGPSFIFLLLFLPVFLSSISLLWSINQLETFKAIIVQLEALLAYVAVINLLNGLSLRAHLIILSCFVVLLLLGSVCSYLPVTWFSPQLPPELHSDARRAFELSYHARLSHPYIGLSNNFATVLTFLIPLLLGLVKALRSNFFKILALLSITGLGATMSRGALLGLILAYTMYSLWYVARRLKVRRQVFSGIVGLLLFSGIGFSGFLLTSQPAYKNVSDRMSVRTVDIRLNSYLVALGAIQERPLTGFGAGVRLDETKASILLRSVHNVYLQGMYWYGLLLGAVASMPLLLVPILVSRLPVRNIQAYAVRQSLVIALLGQALIDMSEASWEASVLRLIVYALIGFSLSLYRVFNQSAPVAYEGVG